MAKSSTHPIISQPPTGFGQFMARTLTPVPDTETVRAEYGEVLRAIAYRWRDLGWSESDKALLLRLYEFFPR